MTQHIKKNLILLLLICLSCKEKNVSKNIVKENKTTVKTINSQQLIKTFTFYKAFSFCESQVDYFTAQEADNLYKNKTIELNIEGVKKSNPSSVYTNEKNKLYPTKFKYW